MVVTHWVMDTDISVTETGVELALRIQDLVIRSINTRSPTEAIRLPPDLRKKGCKGGQRLIMRPMVIGHCLEYAWRAETSPEAHVHTNNSNRNRMGIGMWGGEWESG